jgi:hypothetical protein
VIRNLDRLESPGGKPNSPTQTSHAVSNDETNIRAVAGFTSVCKINRFDSYLAISPATPNPVPKQPLNTLNNKQPRRLNRLLGKDITNNPTDDGLEARLPAEYNSPRNEERPQPHRSHTAAPKTPHA